MGDSLKSKALFSKRSQSHIQEIEDSWKTIINRLEKDFGEIPDLQSVLFLIGLQELGKGYHKYSKDQKLEIFHVAICTLLEPYGLYNYLGMDSDGYPHWEKVENIPLLSPGKQTLLIKQAIIDYFREI